MKPRPLFVQLFGSYLFITFVLLFIFIIIARTTFRNFYFTRISDDLHSRAELVKDHFLYNLSIKYYSKLQDTAVQLGEESNTHIRVIAMDGEVLADSHAKPDTLDSNAELIEFVNAAKDDRGEATRYSDVLGESFMYVAIPVKDAEENIAIIRLGMPIGSLNTTLKQIGFQLSMGGILCAILVAFLSWFLSRKMSKPLEEIKLAAERIKSGDFISNLEFRASATLEVQALGQSMNQMAKQLQKRIDTILSQKTELDTVFASMSEGLLTVDRDEKIGHINASAAKILHLNPEEVKAKNFEAAIDIAQVNQYIRNALSKEYIDEQEVIIFDGKKITLRMRGSQLTDAKGIKKGVVIVINDITEIVLAEKQRRDFVNNVSHELRTPLTSIQGFAETLMNPAVKDPAEVRKFVEIIHKHANRLNALIEDILALSRLEKDTESSDIELSLGSVNDCIQNAADLCRAKASKFDIEINTTCDKAIEIRMNTYLLEQAIVNLIDNALKYSEAKSRIEVFVEQTSEWVKVHVKDYGSGISQKHLARLFERFYRIDKARTSSIGGTGLGLAIVKHVAVAHGGQVDVSSAVGEGSTFSLLLPRPQ